MAILEVESLKRIKVLWVGQSVPEGSLLLLKQLQLSAEELLNPNKPIPADDLSRLAGAIFVQSETDSQTVVTWLSTNVKRLLDYGCLVFVFATVDGLSTVIEGLKHLKVTSMWPSRSPQGEGLSVFDGRDEKDYADAGGDPPIPHVRVFRAAISPEYDAIKSIVQYAPRSIPASEVSGASSDGFRITGPASSDIKGTHKLMLQRSFHDCGELYLDYVSETGHSGVPVYIAHADIKQSPGARCLLTSGPRKVPFFVKIGSRRKITKEWRNYELYVRQQIPFHLAPRLVNERCELGAKSGIIVGDFVEGSESLGECSQDGRATTPIGTLFEHTLRSWHRHAQNEDGRLLNNSLQGLLKDDVPLSRLDQSRTLHQVETTVEDFRRKLRQRGTDKLLWGQIHGDLHAGNIRVRGSDAILIDFLSTGVGPLLADPAALEISLAIRVPRNRDFDAKAWTKVMWSLLEKDALSQPPGVNDPTDKYAWLAACVRQIRLHAMPMQRSPDQYACVLAYFLYQAAAKDTDSDLSSDPNGHEEYRRASAYAFGERLLNLKW